VHIQHHVQAVLVQHGDRGRDPVQVRGVDAAPAGLELRPVDAQANHVEARALHQPAIPVVQGRRRILRIRHKGVRIETAK